VVPINADVARRTACDAELIPIVLDTRAESLNIGRQPHRPRGDSPGSDLA
jgi:hypothetical protein